MSFLKATIRSILIKLLGENRLDAIRHFINGKKILSLSPFFSYDQERFHKYSGAANPQGHDTLRAKIIKNYHVLEKGITMPQRKSAFGKDVIKRQIKLIEQFKTQFGTDDAQVQHAIAVLKEYWNIHIDYSEKQNEHEFWESLESFINGFPDIPASCHRTITKNEFYRQKEASFPQFAWARHTLRYYSSIPLSETQIKAAIDLARSTPSACNRQHCRVHCVSDKKQIQALLDIQAGNRGFGHLADKLLVITSDLEVNLEERERNDVYVNGGMFLMNLCYALYYYEIAHCILNWSRTPAEDQAVREIIRLKPSETVIAVLSCGNTPDEFMVASSPRKSLEEYYVKE